MDIIQNQSYVLLQASCGIYGVTNVYDSQKIYLQMRGNVLSILYYLLSRKFYYVLNASFTYFVQSYFILIYLCYFSICLQNINIYTTQHLFVEFKFVLQNVYIFDRISFNMKVFVTNVSIISANFLFLAHLIQKVM